MVRVLGCLHPFFCRALENVFVDLDSPKAEEDEKAVVDEACKLVIAHDVVVVA